MNCPFCTNEILPGAIVCTKCQASRVRVPRLGSTLAIWIAALLTFAISGILAIGISFLIFIPGALIAGLVVPKLVSMAWPKKLIWVRRIA